MELSAFLPQGKGSSIRPSADALISVGRRLPTLSD